MSSLDCAPIVEGKVSIVSKQRLARSLITHANMEVNLRPGDQLVVLQADGGWIAVYRFSKQEEDGRVSDRLRHYAMWQGQNGSCVFKVYET